jgi:hypothetical protein
MKAMDTSDNFLLEGDVEVDENYIGGQDEELIGRNEGKEKLAVIAVEKKGRYFKRMHRSIMLFKAWSSGTHHSVIHLQAY